MAGGKAKKNKELRGERGARAVEDEARFDLMETDEEVKGWETVLGEWISSSMGGQEVDDDEDGIVGPGAGGSGGADADQEDLPEQNPDSIDPESMILPAGFTKDLNASLPPSSTTLPSSLQPSPSSSKSKPSSFTRPSATQHSTTSSNLPQTQEELDAAQDEAIFLNSYIPRTLSEVYDPERDVGLVQGGKGGDLIYARSGGVGIVGVDRAGQKTIAEEEEEDGDEDNDEDGSEGSDSGEGFVEKGPRGKRHEDKDAKKVRLSLFSRSELWFFNYWQPNRSLTDA